MKSLLAFSAVVAFALTCNAIAHADPLPAVSGNVQICSVKGETMTCGAKAPLAGAPVRAVKGALALTVRP